MAVADRLGPSANRFGPRWVTRYAHSARCGGTSSIGKCKSTVCVLVTWLGCPGLVARPRATSRTYWQGWAG